MLLETSFAKCRFSIAPAYRLRRISFRLDGPSRRQGPQGLTMLSKSRHVASSDGTPWPSRGVASTFGPGGCSDSNGPGRVREMFRLEASMLGKTRHAGYTEIRN